MPGVVEEYVKKQQDIQESVHADLYWAMRADGFSPQDVSDWFNERTRENPKMTAAEMSSIYLAEFTVSEYAGGRYEGLGADVHDYARAVRERAPTATIEQVYDAAAGHLISDIRAYDKAVEAYRQTIDKDYPRQRVG